MTEKPTPFLEAYPAPWRIQGGEVVDVDGNHIIDFETLADPAEGLFWQGIVDAVNSYARIEGALQMARAL